MRTVIFLYKKIKLKVHAYHHHNSYSHSYGPGTRFETLKVDIKGF